MAKIRFMINPKKLQNFAYFEPFSGLHLTRREPIGSIDELQFNDNILNAVKNATIIDLDGNIDTDKGTLTEAKVVPEETKKEVKKAIKEETEEVKETKEEKKSVDKKETKTK